MRELYKSSLLAFNWQKVEREHLRDWAPTRNSFIKDPSCRLYVYIVRYVWIILLKSGAVGNLMVTHRIVT